MTHLYSDRVTHAKNTICRRATEEASDLIHAEGVSSDLQSSAPGAQGAQFERGHPKAEPPPPFPLVFLKSQTPSLAGWRPYLFTSGAGSVLASKVW